jgi:hypothetical protein
VEDSPNDRSGFTPPTLDPAFSTAKTVRADEENRRQWDRRYLF